MVKRIVMSVVMAGGLMLYGSSAQAMDALPKVMNSAVKVGTKALTVSMKMATSEASLKANQEAALEMLKSIPQEYHETIQAALLALNDSIKAGLVPVTGVVSIVEIISNDMIAPVSKTNADKLKTKLVDPIKGQLVLLKNVLKTVAHDLTATPEEIAQQAAAVEAEAEKAESEPVKEEAVISAKPTSTSAK